MLDGGYIFTITTSGNGEDVNIGSTSVLVMLLNVKLILLVIKAVLVAEKELS